MKKDTQDLAGGPGTVTLSRRHFLSATTAAIALGTRPAEAVEAHALPSDLMRDELATVTRFSSSSPNVAMTFDDGPHPSLTPILLETLRKRKMRATFYLIGRSAVTWPDVVKRIADEGHEIGNHTWSHPNMALLGDAQMLAQIDRTNEAIYKITGRPAVTFRPPYGAFTLRQRKMLFQTRGMPTVLWSVDPHDWQRPGAEIVKSRILEQSHPGAIILSHDIHSATVDAMPATFDALTDRGLSFGSLSQMVGWPLWQMRGFHRVGARIEPTGRTGLPVLQ